MTACLLFVLEIVFQVNFININLNLSTILHRGKRFLQKEEDEVNPMFLTIILEI